METRQLSPEKRKKENSPLSQATQCVRGVLDPPVSAFTLSLHRHPFLYTLFSSRFTLIINNKLRNPCYYSHHMYTGPSIPLPRFFISRQSAFSSNQSVVLTPEQSAWTVHDVCSCWNLYRLTVSGS
jgi:hypothetical protein